VAGLGEQISSVQLRIRDGLLQHENLEPQLEQFVERRRVEVLGPDAMQCERHSRDTASRSVSLCTSASAGAGGMPLAGLSNSNTFAPHDDHSCSSSVDSCLHAAQPITRSRLTSGHYVACKRSMTNSAA
jgi:hypothetical protein